MATRELITQTVGDGKYVKSGFNVSATVGTRGANEKGDVMVIQALLKYIALSSFISVPADSQIKDVNGYFNAETASAIRWFQHKFNTHLISQDGLVHPASFKNRSIKFGGKQMMIFFLNVIAAQAALFHSRESNYTEAIFKEFPQLKLWVKDV